MGNPRKYFEASGNGMILVIRERQPHDVPLSCGNQPAYIRLIYRRNEPALHLASNKKCKNSKNS